MEESGIYCRNFYPLTWLGLIKSQVWSRSKKRVKGKGSEAIEE